MNQQLFACSASSPPIECAAQSCLRFVRFEESSPVASAQANQHPATSLKSLSCPSCEHSPCRQQCQQQAVSAAGPCQWVLCCVQELELKARQFQVLLQAASPLTACPNANLLACRAIVEELCRLGVNTFAIAPGQQAGVLHLAHSKCCLVQQCRMHRRLGSTCMSCV